MGSTTLGPGCSDKVGNGAMKVPNRVSAEGWHRSQIVTLCRPPEGNVNWVTGIEVYVSSGLSRDGSSTSASGRTSDMDIWWSREFGPERAGKIYCFVLRTCKNV